MIKSILYDCKIIIVCALYLVFKYRLTNVMAIEQRVSNRVYFRQPIYSKCTTVQNRICNYGPNYICLLFQFNRQSWLITTNGISTYNLRNQIMTLCNETATYTFYGTKQKQVLVKWMFHLFYTRTRTPTRTRTNTHQHIHRCVCVNKGCKWKLKGACRQRFTVSGTLEKTKQKSRRVLG